MKVTSTISSEDKSPLTLGVGLAERACPTNREEFIAHDLTEGWMTYPHHPRFGSNYRGLTNRLDLLLECYSYLAFPDRVRTTYATLLEALTYVAGHRDDVVQVVAASRVPRAAW